MTTYSQIQITFNQDLPIGTSLELGINTLSPPTINFLNEIFKAVRQQPGEVFVGVPTATVGEISAFNFVQAFNLDFNATNAFQVVQAVNVVTISSFSSHTNFGGGECILPDTSAANVQFLVQNYSGSGYAIQSVSFSQADSNFCNKVKVNVVTTENTKKIFSPIVQDIAPPSLNFSFDVNRNQNINLLRVQNVNNNFVNAANFQVPSLLNIADRQIQIDPTASGINITIFLNVLFLNLEFSLDGTTFQSSNSFVGLIAGTYTVYVRDQFGCQKDFTLDLVNTNIYNPYFFISKSNSIRYANRIIFGDAANLKTDENTLSCEEEVLLPYKAIQLFQSTDKVTTQFLSNYSSNIAKVIKEDASVDVILMEQKSNNIGVTDSRDAILFDLTNGKSGIYFISGQIYDYNTGAAIDTYELNGNLPSWAVVGNYLKIGVLSYLIEETYFEESKNSDVIVISLLYPNSNPETSIITKCLYNKFSFEVFEYTIDMLDYLDQNISVQLECTDSNYPDITHLSEEINVQVKQEDTVAIRYWNDSNTDIFYSTGIRNILRIPFFKKYAADTDQSENFYTDTNAILLNSEVREVTQFEFEPLTTEFYRKLKQALSHREVYIDEVKYVKSSEFEIENAIEQTNLHQLNAKMAKAGSPFQSDGSNNLDFNTGSIAVPGLVKTNSGFVKY